ncbi:hypothetical protein DK37_11920 [Halomonas sp. SUBG004]|nr:hypothetical protein DK37_11920 [Halomonas sp. SUBG004]
MAAEIDRQVIGGYRLFPSHYLALEALGESPELVARKAITRQDRERFKARLASVPRSTASLLARAVRQPCETQGRQAESLAVNLRMLTSRKSAMVKAFIGHAWSFCQARS